MRIQHNIAALNSYRNLTNNNSAVSKNLEKLSSGYKINRAGDDAAGLAISEKMRAQITGLETAQKNANDGISLVQTAEGALTEVHSMLNRMVELANQSANGTYDDKDREQLQKEIVSLKDEIDRISEGTNFNGINLLDGSLGSTGGAKVAVDVKYSGLTTKTNVLELKGAEAAEAKLAASKGTPTGLSTTNKNTLEVQFIDANGNVQKKTVEFTAGNTDLKNTGNNAALTDAFQEIFGDGYTASVAAGELTVTSKEPGSADQIQILDVKVFDDNGDAVADAFGTPSRTDGEDAYYQLNADQLLGYKGEGKAEDFIFEINGQKFAFANAAGAAKLDPDVHVVVVSNADSLDNTAGEDIAKMKDLINNKTGIGATHDAGDNFISLKAGTKGGTTGNGLTLQIGDTAESFNQLTVSVGNMSSSSLGIGGIDISTQVGAKNAVGAIKAAINSVSSTRGDLGAIQNRLEHTINNLSVTTENMTAAESRIRDVDMANEMMAYTKNNILVQSSQAMLAQANQIPQGVLQLLQ